MPLIVRLSPEDNVIVARAQLDSGVKLEDEEITTLESVPSGHKLATSPIEAGEEIRKYGLPIGRATKRILPGQHVHVHNVEPITHGNTYEYGNLFQSPHLIAKTERAQFNGYRRSDGRVGTRNSIGIFITVNCSATVARKIASHFTKERLSNFKNVDNVVAFVHEQGCGMELRGEPMALLRRTLAGYVNNPNIAGALVISLGCERNNLAAFFEEQKLVAGKTIRVITMQEVGGTSAAIQKGISQVEELLTIANQNVRAPCSAEHLVVGLQCGGSDGLSSLTANPALGAAMDVLISHGGTAVLSETPEIYGAEHLLTARAKTAIIGDKLIERMEWWLKYSEGKDTQINGNVSPGNNSGGITTIVEKSLGGVQKAGRFGLNEVYKYAEKIEERGFVFMDTPGYDPVSVTGQIAGGANLICFTTGRGSCFGSYPSPTLKLASNTPMYLKMAGDMDINCGEIAEGTRTLSEVGREIFELILRTASGEETKSESLGVGDEEFCPWPIGILN
jgi:altronate hydrolase